MGTSRWGSLEDILNSDDESAITDNSKKKLKKKSSTTSQASSDKKFNPRDDPKLNGYVTIQVCLELLTTLVFANSRFLLIKTY